uniref:ribosomal protein L20 n=1 Tax=Anemia phyllitidis TaxID=12940 RepID=UPI0021ABDA4F|nr:ribosomal protein L20 [Anemia phyllitidis]UUL71097.1 ribosomal protein L20 [Anemia phyllitidis]
MTRVKRGSVARKRRNKIIEMASGAIGSHSKLFRTANQQRVKAFFNAYQDRRNRKREIRRLWITRISAALRQNDMNYSNFINYLYTNQICLNRKMLGQMVVLDTDSFSTIIQGIRTKAD